MTTQANQRIPEISKKIEIGNWGLIPIQNSKLRKPYVARVFKFGSVAEF
ncbi:hypothetical protein H6G64_15830 [Calothrix sp. FACHB-156]|nr:hypothetical protein [Nostoc linckia FACHB-104]MBD2338444.1 hypothetical protein [Calothrix sp. FACHB-156]